MGLTLGWYILRELLRVLVLTALVLIGAISFAAAIRPLTDGLLDPLSLLKFVGFTAPTVLGFVLPFAGAFASTMVYHRLAADNEVLACAAGGLSYQRVLRPALLLGMACTVILFYLSTSLIPRYYRAAQSVITADAVSALVNQLDGQEPFTRDRFALYADAAAAYDPAEVPALAELQRQRTLEKVVELRGVAVAQLDDRGAVREDATAEQAQIIVERRPDSGDKALYIRLDETFRLDPVQRNYVNVEALTIGPWIIEDPLRDDIRFYSAAEMAALEDEPSRFDRVREATDRLRLVLATETLRRLIVGGLQSAEPGVVGSGITLQGPIGRERYVLRAASARIERDRLELTGATENPEDPDGGRVVIERYHSADDAVPARVYEARRAVVAVTNRLFLDDQLEVNIRLFGVRVPGADVRQAEVPLNGLTWPNQIFTPLAPAPSADSPPTDNAAPATGIGQLSFEAIRTMVDQPPYADRVEVQRARGELYDQLLSLKQDIRSHSHERAASAVACALLVMLGALLAIWLRDRPPLITFFWAFLLAALTLVLINTGRTLGGSTRFPTVWGLMVLWCGNVLLAAGAGAIYCRIARH